MSSRIEDGSQSRHMTRKERRELAREAEHAYKEHLHRLFVAQRDDRRLQKEHAAKHREHVVRLAVDHKIRIAEMNGDVSSKSIRVWEAYVASVPIKLISVDLNDPTVKVSALLARNGIGSAEPFARMIRRSQPDVAVTGTFFSLDNLRPIGDIVINGVLAYFGGMGTALCITPANQAQMITVPWGHHHDWSSYNFVMACGPRLLSNGQIVLDPKSERFHDHHMLSPNSRIAVGITPGNKLVFVMTKKPIYLGRLAKVMAAEGCSDAMNLDAGTSTGFYCEGNMMARPGRWLTNAIVVFANQHLSQHVALPKSQHLPVERKARIVG
jgi:exopolysaccharide biosynthesis protein